MDTLTIEGIPAYNGEYPLDLTYFNNYELRLIKLESGVRAGELAEAFEAGDNDLTVCIAAIMVWRKNGKRPEMEPFWNAEVGKFTLNIETPEAEEDESLPPSIEPEQNEASDGSSKDAGETSNGSSAHQENVLPRIGLQG